jgi:hypothetical protein
MSDRPRTDNNREVVSRVTCAASSAALLDQNPAALNEQHLEIPMGRLRSISNHSLVKHLIVALTHGSIPERCEAAQEIERLVAADVTLGREALPALLAAAADRERVVREQVLCALAAFPPTPEIDRALAGGMRLMTTEHTRSERDPRSAAPHDRDMVDVPASTSHLSSQLDRLVAAVAPEYETLLPFLSSGGIDPAEVSNLSPEALTRLYSGPRNLHNETTRVR